MLWNKCKKIEKIISNKKFSFFLFLFFLIIPYLVYFPLLLEKKIFVSGDGVLSYCYRAFNSIALKEMEFPFWNKYLENGMPYAADFIGEYSPFNLVGVFLGHSATIYFFYSIITALGALFVFLYLNKTGCDVVCSLVTTVLYYFSIHIGGYRKEHVLIIAAIIFLPMVLYFTERLLSSKRLREPVFLSIALLAPMLIGGHLQIVFYLYLTVVVYTLIEIFTGRIKFGEAFKKFTLTGLFYLGFSLIELLPVVELYRFYGQESSMQSSYSFFSSFSINPFKIISIFIPNFFGKDVFQPFGVFQSTGFDIELFVGSVVSTISLYGILFFRKDKVVIRSAIIMVLAWIYAACAHVPVLRRALYAMPIIGSFRVPSRILFVFIFFNLIIFARTLSIMKEKQDFIDKYYKSMLRFILTVILTASTLGIVNIILVYKEVWLSLSDIQFIIEGIIHFVVVLLFLGILLLVLQKKSYENLKKVNIILAFALVVTFWEVYPYYSASHSSRINEAIGSTVEIEELKKEIGNYKLWSATTHILKSYAENINDVNSNQFHGLPSINAYVHFNNPRLIKLFNIGSKPGFNETGSLGYFLSAKNNLIFQNDVLSMLGVKYIIDDENLITKKGEAFVKKSGTENVVLQEPEIHISTEKDINVWFKKITVIPENSYSVSFDAESDSDVSLFYVDFYGGANYDKIEQERHIKLMKGKKKVFEIINTGEIDNINEIYVRIVSNSKNQIILKNFEVKHIGNLREDVYKPFIINENKRIYENINAKDIFYIPQRVQRVIENLTIYENPYRYNFLETAYLEQDETFNPAPTELKNIIWKNNWAGVDVESEGDTFVVFSQNYYPAWRVYIDGQRQKLHMVNGIIQGVKVPAGKHYVKFQYFPKMQIIGGIIFLLTLVSIVVLIILKRKSIIKIEI